MAVGGGPEARKEEHLSNEEAVKAADRFVETRGGTAAEPRSNAMWKEKCGHMIAGRMHFFHTGGSSGPMSVSDKEAVGLAPHPGTASTWVRRLMSITNRSEGEIRTLGAGLNA